MQDDFIARAFLKGIGNALVQLWYVWVLIALVLLGKLAFRLYEKHRLAGSGISDIDTMGGKTFEKYLEVLFERLGYNVTRTRYIGDYGADLVVEKDGIKTVVQAKRYKTKVGVKAIQEAVAAKGHYGCDAAMVVTNSYFTDQAKKLAASNNVELWNRKDLIENLLAMRVKDVDALEVSTPGSVIPPNTCAVCNVTVSRKVQQYCLDHPERFGGKIYCYEHQKMNSNLQKAD